MRLTPHIRTPTTFSTASGIFCLPDSCSGCPDNGRARRVSNVIEALREALLSLRGCHTDRRKMDDCQGGCFSGPAAPERHAMCPASRTGLKRQSTILSPGHRGLLGYGASRQQKTHGGPPWCFIPQRSRKLFTPIRNQGHETGTLARVFDGPLEGGAVRSACGGELSLAGGHQFFLPATSLESRMRAADSLWCKTATILAPTRFLRTNVSTSRTNDDFQQPIMI